MISIGIIGDYNPEKVSHPATDSSIEHAAGFLGIEAGYEWIPTPSLSEKTGLDKLERFDGLWASSGSPYLSMEGALNGIRFARENDVPLFGT